MTETLVERIFLQGETLRLGILLSPVFFLIALSASLVRLRVEQRLQLREGSLLTAPPTPRERAWRRAFMVVMSIVAALVVTWVLLFFEQLFSFKDLLWSWLSGDPSQTPQPLVLPEERVVGADQTADRPSPPVSGGSLWAYGVPIIGLWLALAIRVGGQTQTTDDPPAEVTMPRGLLMIGLFALVSTLIIVLVSWLLGSSLSSRIILGGVVFLLLAYEAASRLMAWHWRLDPLRTVRFWFRFAAVFVVSVAGSLLLLQLLSTILGSLPLLYEVLAFLYADDESRIQVPAVVGNQTLASAVVFGILAAFLALAHVFQAPLTQEAQQRRFAWLGKTSDVAIRAGGLTLLLFASWTLALHPAALAIGWVLS